MSPPKPAVGKVGLLLGLVAGMSGLGFAALPIVLQDLRDGLALSDGQVAGVVTAFTLGLAVSAPISGRLLDALGPRRTLLQSTAVLVLGAVCAASSNALAPMLAGRFIEGLGAGGVSLAAFATAPRIYPPGQTAAAQGVLTATSVMCLALGPLLGAGLAAVGTWRLSVLAPLGLLALLPLVLPLLSSRRLRTGPFDIVGGALMAAVTAAITLLAQGGAVGLPWAAAVGVAAIAVVAGARLPSHVRRRPDGLIPAVLLHDRRALTLAAAAASCFGAYMVLALLVPRQLHEERGWSLLTIGMALLPAAAVGAAAAAVAGRFIERWGAARTLAILSLAAAASLAVGAAVPPPLGPIAAMTGGVVVFAVGQVALIDGVPFLAPVADRGAALGLGNMLFLSGGTFGTALAASATGIAGIGGALLLLTPLPVLGAFAAVRVHGRRPALPAPSPVHGREA